MAVAVAAAVVELVAVMVAVHYRLEGYETDPFDS